MTVSPARTDRGETLLELIVAVSIMGIAVVATVSGVAMTVLTSDLHRKQATAGAAVRNYAETVEAYVADGHFDSSSVPDYRAATVGYTVPQEGYSVMLVSVRCWDAVTQVFGSCASGSTLQRVALSVGSTDARVSESIVLVVRRP